MKRPQKLPINVKQVAGHPFVMTESGWNLPHKYMAEGPFLISTIQSITGFDAYYWFAIEGVDYMRNPYFDFTKDATGKRAMHRWTCSVPGMLGQFPANSLLYRLAYLKPGEVVYHEEKPMEKLWNREISPIVEETNFDPNRDTENKLNSATDSEISPLAFLTGTVNDTGTMPWKADATQVTVELANAGIKKATLLDAGGYAAGNVKIKSGKGKISLALPSNAMYVLLEK